MSALATEKIRLQQKKVGLQVMHIVSQFHHLTDYSALRDASACWKDVIVLFGGIYIQIVE